MNGTSAVNFSEGRRVHIGLGVHDVAQSVKFYTVLFSQEPTKVREGYAKFEIESPSLNLSLNEVAGAPYPRHHGALHYGIQVKSSQEVVSAIDRFSESQLETAIEEEVNCCYAVQDKVWVTDPDGNKWEVFVVLEADAKKATDKAKSECCVDIPEGATCAS